MPTNTINATKADLINDLERRRRKRVKTQLLLRLDYNNSEALALTKNISLLGTCLNMNREILPGTRVALSVDIPRYVDKDWLVGEVRGEGAVIRCDPVVENGETVNYELGIFFSSFLPSGEEKLFNYLDYAAKEEEIKIRQWAEQYRDHIKNRKRKIANKKRAQARKKAALLAKRIKKAEGRAVKSR